MSSTWDKYTDVMKAAKKSSDAKDNNHQDRRNACHVNDEVKLLLDNLAGFIFGSCVSVVEVASTLVPESWQNTRSNRKERKKQRNLDPRLAKLAGRYQSKSINPQESNEGVPSFLESETIDYSVEEHTVFDDNISALSAFTLEEMARVNGHTGAARLGEKLTTLHSAPSVTRTNSSSSSSHGRARRKVPFVKKLAVDQIHGTKGSRHR